VALQAKLARDARKALKAAKLRAATSGTRSYRKTSSLPWT
jgi:hypothetical protein